MSKHNGNNRITEFNGHMPRSVRLHGRLGSGFRRQVNIYNPMPHDRIIGPEQFSAYDGEEFRTLFMTTSANDSEMVTDTRDDTAPIRALAEHIWSLGFQEHIKKQAWVKQRKRRVRNGEKKERSDGGMRQTVTPIASIHWDLEAYLGRAFRRYPQFKKLLRAGEPRTEIHIPGDWKIEITHIRPGSGGSAELLISKDREIARIWMFSLKGYLDDSPEVNTREFLGDNIVIEPVPKEWKNRQIESFTEEELDRIKKYTITKGMAARNTYIELSEMLMDISPYAMRRYGPKGNYGMLPNSVAGLAAKMAFNTTDQKEWPAPSHRVQQIGALTFMSGYQFFNHEFRGYNENLWLVDGDSWHGFTMCQPPDPATCEYIDIPHGPLDIGDWLERGVKFGSVLISGIPTGGIYTPLRIHDPAAGRLKYINEPFTRQWITIPEMLMAVVSGRLKVSYIHDGVWIKGSNENSFLRRHAQKMYEIKRNAAPGSPRYNLAKKLMIALPGKLKEVNWGTPWVTPIARTVDIPKHLDRQQNHELFNAYNSSIADLDRKANELLAQVEDPYDTIKWGKAIDRMSHGRATTGAYYLSMHAAQIWGMAAGMLSLAAYCTNAISGYTDSLITRGDPSEGLARFRELMEEAGYEAPGVEGLGSFKYKIKDGHGYLAKASLWVIRHNTQHTDIETGEVTLVEAQAQSQALHTLDNLGNKDTWEVIKEICETKDYSYMTEDKPYTLLEAYINNVEPGTPKSYERKVSLKPKSEEIDEQAVKQAEDMLRRANNRVAGESTQDIPTTQTSQGCIKMLTKYGLSLRDISNRSDTSYDTIRNISSGKKPGAIHLLALQELVTRVEQEKLHSREPGPEHEPDEEPIETRITTDIENIDTTTLEGAVQEGSLPTHLDKLVSDELLRRGDIEETTPELDNHTTLHKNTPRSRVQKDQHSRNVGNDSEYTGKHPTVKRTRIQVPAKGGGPG